MVHAIGHEQDSTLEPNDGFTTRGANKMLPLVRRIVQDMVRLDREIDAQRQQLRGVDLAGQTMTPSSYQDELDDIRESLADDEAQLASCIAELTALGIQSHQPIDGCVDFPAIVHRRPVRLCWNIQEDIVCHWHEVGETGPREKIADAT